MTRSRKRPSFKCPEGHSCDWCGPKVARERQEARARQIEDETSYYDEFCEKRIGCTCNICQIAPITVVIPAGK